ncbi:MAG: molybdenum cofactor biosynthesis protein MoaE [Candidatus Thorarchaeota archaeon]
MTEKSLGGIFPKGSKQLEDIIKEVTSGSNHSKSGAIFTFTGYVRESSLFNSAKVKEIEIEAWDEKVFETMNAICQELITKFELTDARIWHGTGRFFIGEPLVYIVISSAHRGEGLKAMEEAIHLYKTRAPIWKKEIYENGQEEWISGKEKGSSKGESYNNNSKI